MAANTPFIAITGSVSGKSAILAVASTSVSVVMSITVYAPSLLVTAQGPTGVCAFVRMTGQSIPVATNLDVPVVCGQGPYLFANPVPGPSGNLGVAAICSLTSSPVNVYFTPGQGGM